MRIDGNVRVATVDCLWRNQGAWYFVAGWGHPSIPHKNTSNETIFASEAVAKTAAMAYVRAFLASKVGGL